MTDALTDLLTRAVDDGTVPGAVALVSRGDESRIVTAGAMAVGGPPMREDAIFRIQSMTKAITTVATLLLVQSRELALEDPVSRWLPELAHPRVLRTPAAELDDVVPAERPILVRDLLTNGSGYGMTFEDTPLARAMVDGRIDPGQDHVLRDADDALAALAQLPLTFQPGQGFRYHHGFSVLGVLLQRATGTPLHEHLRAAVCEPLGMPDTGLFVPEEHADRLPAQYRHTDDGLTEAEPMGGGFYVGTPPFDTAHGELVSTAADYGRFARMLADGGRHEGRVFLDPALVAEMTRDQVPASVKTPDSFYPGFWDGMGWGYGVCVTLGGDHPGRFGWSGGGGTDFFVDPDGAVAILLTQVELGQRMWPLLMEFQQVAGA